MNASRLKGSLLEYIVRKLLSNCGFVKVNEDKPFIFKKGILCFINGKGAAHDADVLMNPPIQMPFSYPYRINFECKAYNKKTGLTIIRNALGLRYDINDFEIVTRDHIEGRANTSRRSFAIEERQRFNYQVGVASVNDFTKDAFEFAANNKIPLISLRWLLPDHTCDLFNDITDNYLRDFSPTYLEILHRFLKGEDDNLVRNINSHFKTILDAFETFENRTLIGLLESGDMLFLVSEAEIDRTVFNNNILEAKFYYGGDYSNKLDYWTININERLNLKFYLPERIVRMWKDQNFSEEAALSYKGTIFSKVYVFPNNNENREMPFRVVKIDRKWLREAIERL